MVERESILYHSWDLLIMMTSQPGCGDNDNCGNNVTKYFISQDIFGLSVTVVMWFSLSEETKFLMLRFFLN